MRGPGTDVVDLARQAALRAAAEHPDAEVRVRAYVMGTPELAADPERRFFGHASAREMFGVSGMKLWADGTPWQGSIATSFPFLDNDTTARVGLDHCAHGTMNYGPDELADLAVAFTAQGFPLGLPRARGRDLRGRPARLREGGRRLGTTARAPSPAPAR
ncbi:hypothetical protein ACFVFJ_27345 [Streptomyces sp. NPDC057717]|uniref:hypothetical protein n=1 Tax=Streptomyces sp. NPDC057717 TaxID=3346224 RepID=UPI00368E8B7F